jgi:hypothetical protein
MLPTVIGGPVAIKTPNQRRSIVLHDDPDSAPVSLPGPLFVRCIYI